jgi:hypothetical protein
LHVIAPFVMLRLLRYALLVATPVEQLLGRRDTSPIKTSKSTGQIVAAVYCCAANGERVGAQVAASAAFNSEKRHGINE